MSEPTREHRIESLKAGQCPKCKSSLCIEENPLNLTIKCDAGCGWQAVYPIRTIGNSDTLTRKILAVLRDVGYLVGDDGETITNDEEEKICALIDLQISIFGADSERARRDESMAEVLSTITSAFKARCESWDEWCGMPGCPKCGNDAVLIASAESFLLDKEREK